MTFPRFDFIHPVVGQDGDDLIRAMLLAASDDGRTPRETEFFFLGGNFKGLAATARRTGYKARITSPPSAGVVLTVTTAVDKKSFEPHVKQMRGWASKFGCDYDGWHTDLVPADHERARTVLEALRGEPEGSH